MSEIVFPNSLVKLGLEKHIDDFRMLIIIVGIAVPFSSLGLDERIVLSDQGLTQEAQGSISFLELREYT